MRRGRADIPAGRLHLAHRGDRPRPRDRHPRARRPGADALLEGRQPGRPVELGEAIGASSALGARSSRPKDARSATTASTSARRATCSPTCASRPTPPACCPTSARSCSSASATRSATGACACSPRFGGRVHAAWALALSARMRERFDLEVDAHLLRRRHRPAPARARREEATRCPPSPSSCCSIPRRSSRRSSQSSAARPCSARAFARTPPARCSSRAPARLAHAAVAAAPEGARTCWRWRARYADFPIMLETYRECLATCSTCRASSELLRGLHSREISARRCRDPRRLAVRLLAALRLRRHLYVRGRHAQRRAPRRGAVARPRPAARAARPGGAARADRPRGRCSGSRNDLQRAPS